MHFVHEHGTFRKLDCAVDGEGLSGIRLQACMIRVLQPLDPTYSCAQICKQSKEGCISYHEHGAARKLTILLALPIHEPHQDPSENGIDIF